jgi:hypothetical protein
MAEPHVPLAEPHVPLAEPHVPLAEPDQETANRIVSVNIRGGMGNQMFQIAAAYAYAKREKGNLQIRYMDRYEKNDGRDIFWDSVLIRARPYLVSRLPPLPVWKEICPTTYSVIPPLTDEGIFLTEYMQSSKYFADEESKKAIKELLRADDDQIRDICIKYKPFVDQKHRVVVMHARRTDFLQHAAVHAPLMGEYYREAVQCVLKTVENPIFLLASDDNSYWPHIESYIPEVYAHEHFTVHESDVQTMYLLQQFNYFVMSNSTFIWWIVWLADAKKVWTPAKWFGPRGPTEFEDVYEPSWEKITLE